MEAYMLYFANVTVLYIVPLIDISGCTKPFVCLNITVQKEKLLTTKFSIFAKPKLYFLSYSAN